MIRRIYDHVWATTMTIRLWIAHIVAPAFVRPLILDAVERETERLRRDMSVRRGV